MNAEHEAEQAAPLTDTMNLEHARGQVDANCRNNHVRYPIRLEWSGNASTLAHQCHIGWGVRSIDSSPVTNPGGSSTAMRWPKSKIKAWEKARRAHRQDAPHHRSEGGFKEEKNR